MYIIDAKCPYHDVCAKDGHYIGGFICVDHHWEKCFRFNEFEKERKIKEKIKSSMKVYESEEDL
jgi:hypothetical protein